MCGASRFLLLIALAGAAPAEAREFTVYSSPVKLRYGQVHNKMLDAMDLPRDVVEHYSDGQKAMAIKSFEVDMIRRSTNGTETQVKLSDHYLHHYILYLGSGQAMHKMQDAVKFDVHMARMLAGCHAMTGMGLNMFNDHWRKAMPAASDHEFKMFGSAAGAEYRYNPQQFLDPFRMLLHRPEVWTATLHIINTNLKSSKQPWSPLLECPCTPQRKIDVKNHTIDGKPPDPRIKCSPEFEATGNPSCKLSTYVGGWRCCEHDVFLIDTAKKCKDPRCSEEPVDEVYMKYTFQYEDAQPHARDLEGAACCDVTSVTQGVENIEYDIPSCPQGTPRDQCLHVAESVQPLGHFDQHPLSPDSGYKGSDLVDLVFAAPHLHLAGISLQLIDDVTNEVLCHVHASRDNLGGVRYGNGTTAGNEEGYLVGLETCSWDGAHARRFRRDHPIRSRAVYNAEMGHTGVMSLWLMSVSAVQADVVI